jgi:hypothetical protein
MLINQSSAGIQVSVSMVQRFRVPVFALASYAAARRVQPGFRCQISGVRKKQVPGFRSQFLVTDL